MPSWFPSVFAVIILIAVMSPASRAAPPRPDVTAAALVQPGDHIYGNPHGSVTIVDFYDTSCGPCRLLNRRIERLIAHDHTIRYVPINVPILGDQSVLAAKAIVAAGRQGRRLPMMNALMSQSRLPTIALMQADAARLGLDLGQFDRDIASTTTTRAVNTALRRGTALGVDFVPVVYIGRNRIPGAMSYRELRRLVAHPDQQVVLRVAEGS